MTTEAVYRTELPGVPAPVRGKVRDVYDLGDRLLLVATDRLSAFDCVFPDPIPDKGKVLSQLSAFWFDRMRPLVENHVLSTDLERFPEILRAQRAMLRGRSMLVRKLRMLPVECVARGYLAGSGWKEYTESGTVCGIPLPRGLRESDALQEPIFTPATKAETGHDENIPFEEMVRIVGAEVAVRARDLTLALYREACRHAEEAGIVIADTKFEFGLDGSELILADEALTPDSSRFWPAATYRPGGPQISLDKQFVRDYVEKLGWNKKPPAPALPVEVVAGLRDRYFDIFGRLTGHPVVL